MNNLREDFLKDLEEKLEAEKWQRRRFNKEWIKDAMEQARKEGYEKGFEDGALGNPEEWFAARWRKRAFTKKR